MISLSKNIKSIVFVFLTSTMLFSCSNKIEEIKDFIQQEHLPELYAENIEILRTDSGKIIAKIKAPILERFSKEKEPYDLFKKGLTAISYKNYPKIESYLYCKYARYDIEQKLWEARNDVVAVSSDGDTLKTEQLFWDIKTGKFYSDKYVEITKEKEIIYGMGFSANQDLTHWTIKKIKGNIYLDE